jgi:hypothetical protein
MWAWGDEVAAGGCLSDAAQSPQNFAWGGFATSHCGQYRVRGGGTFDAALYPFVIVSLAVRAAHVDALLLGRASDWVAREQVHCRARLTWA